MGATAVAATFAVVAVDGLADSEQPTSASIMVTTRSGAVASIRLWLKVFTSRRLRKPVSAQVYRACSEYLVSGQCDINGRDVLEICSGADVRVS